MTLVLPAPMARARRLRLGRLPVSLIAGGAILLVSLLLALFPGRIAPYDPLAFDYAALMKGPSWAHWFGSDNFGRDVLSRTIYAYRLDLEIAVFATITPFVAGSLIGALVGYAGGVVEAVFGRVVDAVITFPQLVLVVAIVAVLGPGLNNMFIAIGIVDWVYFARLVAAEVKVQKRLDYADAGRAMGYTPARIIFRHLLPNSITPAIVYWMTDMALAILLGSSLGYLGLGAQPPAAEWGVQIADGKNFMTTAWWMSVFPGIAIVVTGLAFSLVGDGLAELLRTRK
ncbi:MAG TPA: ABC transporter permease [Devosia sp.]|nr:ABC transporter permease [Devosia sp.]